MIFEISVSPCRTNLQIRYYPFFIPFPNQNNFRDSVLAELETEVPSDRRLTAVAYLFLPPLGSRFINLGSGPSLGS